MAPKVSVEDIDVDHIWNTLGPWGRYQWKQLTCYLLICVSWIIHQLSIVFIGYRPDFRCKTTPNVSVATDNVTISMEHNECSIDTYTNISNIKAMTSSDCNNGWVYDIPKHQSFVTEWDLVCAQAQLAELSQTLLVVGMMVGTFICSTLADKVGRKPVMVLSHVILFVIVLVTALSPNYYVLITLRFLTGVVAEGGLSGTTLALETFPKEVRHYTEVLALVIWTTSICIMSPIAYLLRNMSRRYLQIAYALFSIWSIFQSWMLDESLRWVIANGRIDEARRIINNACRWNKKDYDEILKTVGLEQRAEELEDLEAVNTENKEITEAKPNGCVEIKTDKNIGVEKYPILLFFKHPHIRRVSLILWYAWLVDSLVYYGLYMISSDLYGNRYINFFLNGLIEYPAAIFEYFCLARIGRKWTCIICHLIATLGLIIATGLTYTADRNSSMLAAGTAFTLIGKMGITGAFGSANVLTPELYPTNMRNTGLGLASFMGKVGSMIAPFSRNVSHKTRWLPGAVYAALCIVVVFLLAFVPETGGVELPQTVKELSMWYQVNTFTLRLGKNKHASRKTDVNYTNNTDGAQE